MAQGLVTAGRDAYAGRFPERYGPRSIARRMQDLVQEEVRSGLSVLDIGAGRTPTLAREMRPEGVEWIGLDLSSAELDAAPAGSYDGTVVADVTHFQPELEGRFGLVVSFQVLEHVKPLDDAIMNMKRYLEPGGVLIVQMSGALTVQAAANRAIPQRATKWILVRLTPWRTADSVFPAYYHHCWSRPLRRIFDSWREARIEPLYYGAYYVFRRPWLRAFVIFFEEWTIRRGYEALAPYYLVRAVA